MWSWVLLAPLLFGVLVFVLSRLEEWVVAPIDRAERISKLMQSTEGDDLERAVAEYLAPIVFRRPVRIAGDDPGGPEPDTKPFRLPSLGTKRSA